MNESTDESPDESKTKSIAELLNAANDNANADDELKWVRFGLTQVGPTLSVTRGDATKEAVSFAGMSRNTDLNARAKILDKMTAEIILDPNKADVMYRLAHGDYDLYYTEAMFCLTAMIGVPLYFHMVINKETGALGTIVVYQGRMMGTVMPKCEYHSKKGDIRYGASYAPIEGADVGGFKKLALAIDIEHADVNDAEGVFDTYLRAVGGVALGFIVDAMDLQKQNKIGDLTAETDSSK